MENATDALKMGAGILIFVLALIISINAFTEARQTSQTVLEYNDREYDLKYEDRYIEENGTTERVVSAEAIVTAIYKSYTENYKIAFDQPNIVLYKKRDSSYIWRDINYIDLRKESLASVRQRREFIQGILYGLKSFGNTTEQNAKKKEYENLGIQFTVNGIYDQIKTEKYTEKLGVYYEQDTYDDVNTPTANFDQKRIITYYKN